MKRFLIGAVIFALLVNVTSFADEVVIDSAVADIDTDGSRSAVTWFRVFDNLLEDKVTNGLKFFLVLSSLRETSLVSQVNTVVESDLERKNLLDRYGLRADSIHYLMNYYMTTLPQNMYDVQYNYVAGENIYADMYYDQNFDYSAYMVRFYDYLNDMFRQLPPEMQGVISKYDRAQAGEIIVMQGLMNIIIRDYLAFEVYNSASQDVISQEFKLRDNIRQALIDELVQAANFYPETYEGDTSVDRVEIENYIDAFMALGNVILESAEMNLKSTGQMQYAIELMRDTNLLVRTSFTPSQPIIEVTLSMNTDLVELDSSTPLSNGYINSFQLEGSVGGVFKNVVYTIDKPDVATVSPSGLVTLSTKKEGIARVTATVEGYNVYKEIIINVTEQTPQSAVSFYGAYISGYPDGTFQTDRLITRAEIAAMMVRVMRLDYKDNSQDKYGAGDFDTESYKDVDADHWAYTALEIAKREGIVGGYADDTFRPDAPVQRDEMAVLFSNAWKRLNIHQDVYSKHFIKDVQPDHWAFDAINQVYNGNIVKGYEDGTFRPDNKTTRGEVVVMINKMLNRRAYKPPLHSFEDVQIDHWAYGDVEAATRLQEVRQE